MSLGCSQSFERIGKTELGRSRAHIEHSLRFIFRLEVVAGVSCSDGVSSVDAHVDGAGASSMFESMVVD